MDGQRHLFRLEFPHLGQWIILMVSHLTCTRRAHQVTASSLYLLLEDSFSDYCKGIREDSDKVSSLEKWCIDRAGMCPHFQFWHIVLQLELFVLI